MRMQQLPAKLESWAHTIDAEANIIEKRELSEAHMGR